MIKHKIALLLLICVTVAIAAGCGNDNYSPQYDSDGNLVIEKEGRISVFPKELPYDIPYNEKSVALSSVDFYQLRSTNYSYVLFTVVRLDVSALNDEELHWLDASDLLAHCYITHEENGYDFGLMNLLGKLYESDRKTLTFVFTSSFLKENRYSFSGAEIHVVFEATQQEKYEYTYKGESKEGNVVQAVSYTTTVEDPISDAETIEDPLYTHMGEWLNKEADFWASLQK